MMVLRKMWIELNTPSSYHDDWYGGGANQLGHVAIGAAFTGAICIACAMVLGMMPYKSLVFTGLLILYAAGLEYGRQRAPLIDGLWDTFFVMCGVSIILCALTEVSLGRDGIYLKLNEIPALAALGVTALSLMAYVIPRAIRQYKEN